MVSPDDDRIAPAANASFHFTLGGPKGVLPAPECSSVIEAGISLDVLLRNEVEALQKALVKSVDGAIQDHLKYQDGVLAEHVQTIHRLCTGHDIFIKAAENAEASENVKAAQPRTSSPLFASRTLSPPVVVVVPPPTDGSGAATTQVEQVVEPGRPAQPPSGEATEMSVVSTVDGLRTAAPELRAAKSWDRASFSNLAARGNTYMESQAPWSHSTGGKFLISMDHGSWIHRKLYDVFGSWLESFWRWEEPPRLSPLARFVDGALFANISAIVILMNAVQSAVAANEQIAGRSISGPLQIWEIAFMLFYTVELALKLWVHRIHFFLGHGRWWNTFDAALVTLGLFDIVTALDADDDSSGTQFAFLRMLRILRAGRALRSLRALRAVTELRTLLTTVVKSVASLFWSVCMIFFIYYIFSLIIVQVSIANIASPSDDFLEHFGSVQQSMLTLFILSLGGGDLQNFYEFLDPELNKVIVIIFMLVFQITLLNILTGVYVEAAMKYAQPHRSVRAKALQVQEFEDAEELWAFFARHFDSEEISLDELSEFMRRPSNEAFMETFDIRVDPELMFFDIMEKEGKVTLEGLVKFVLWHRGPMTRMDSLRTDLMLKEVMELAGNITNNDRRSNPFLLEQLQLANADRASQGGAEARETLPTQPSATDAQKSPGASTAHFRPTARTAAVGNGESSEPLWTD